MITTSLRLRINLWLTDSSDMDFSSQLSTLPLPGHCLCAVSLLFLLTHTPPSTVFLFPLDS